MKGEVVSQLPLNLRLRNEAEEWDDDEYIKGLILEAAEAIEKLASHFAIQQAAKRYHAGHGPNPHPNCPVCTAADSQQEPKA